MNYFIHHLRLLAPFDAETAEAINGILSVHQLKKGTFLLQNGDICRYFYLLEKGLARVFYHKDGREVTAWFTAENGIVSAIDSLFTGQPSQYNIEILEDATVWALQYDKLEPVFEQYPVVERLGRLLVTHNYLLLDERMKLFAFCTAEERYSRLLEQMPDIFKRVNLGYIASYLGITPEHLSRIRSKK
ncbi:Crp/Fnr family transcriptional regulator [Leadbetterella sp. DM7]|uniref:Crp/Fnr family transcriptional regulator n=1 Tax=Leadbetterella sp. DM7 TaxID=3235085 RepID=UPI00349E6725